MTRCTNPSRRKMRSASPRAAKAAAMGISAFLDESGKFKDHPVVSLCAIVSATAHFNAFADEWGSCLKIAGLEVISAKKVLNANRPLSHKLLALGIGKRADALLPFIACIRKHLAFVTG